ncbi:MAG TPA: type II CAAX endopeptidase family protein [Puia sp.]|nr:type II CAAX endopeptidase family protein [Puia sp.]
MNESLNSKQVISRGWVRAALFCILYFGVALFINIPIAMAVSSAGASEKTTPESLGTGDSLWFIILITSITLIFLVYIFRNFIDRQNISSLGLALEGLSGQAFAGLFLAPSILGVGTIVLYYSGHLQWLDAILDPAKLFITFGLMAMVAFSEELVFRGYILSNLLDSFNKWIALFVSAFVFAVAHNLNSTVNLLSFGGVFLAGLALAINYIYTRNLWFSILFHFSWNFLQGPILGFKVSGNTFPSLLQTELKGDAMITGGEFGFEGSMISILLLLISVSLLYFVYQGKYATKPAVINLQ